MGRLDTSKAGELRVLADKLRRRAREMTIASYIDMMEHAASELDAEAMSLEEDDRRPLVGRRLDIIV